MKKQSFILTLILSVIFIGCGQNSERKIGYNYSIEDKNAIKGTMETISGEEFEITDENSYYDTLAGLGIYLPKEYLNLITKYSELNVIPFNNGKGIYVFVTDTNIDELMTDYKNNITNVIFAIYDTKDTYLQEIEKYEIKKISVENKTVNFAVLKESSAFGEKYQPLIKSVLDIKEELEEHIFVFLTSMEKERKYFGEFNGITMEDKEITQEIFSQYDLTMVNIWATWCKPCVNELDELALLYTQLPEKTNLITICVDAADEPKLAKKILDTKEATFDTIVANESISFLSTVTALPTTVFIDKEGNIIAIPVPVQWDLVHWGHYKHNLPAVS